MTGDAPPTADLIDRLLAADLPAERLAALEAAGLCNASGLGQLLDQAMRLARSDPGQARQLAAICAEAAGPARAPAIFPRAAYLRAQAHAINGEFSTARELIESARAAYEAIGERLEALRTNIGLMHVLNELGRHAEALAAGQAVLDALDRPEPPTAERLVLALAYLNRGVCFETTGRYQDALEAYARAEAHFTVLEMPERVGDVANNRGIVLVHLGRVGEALEALEAAERLWAEAGQALPRAQTLGNIGDAHLLLGGYTRALQAYEQARQLLEPLDAVAHKGILLRKTADAYLALNLHPESLAAYRQAEALLRQAGMADHQARALWGMGAALAALGRASQAAEALAQAAALFEAASNTPMLSAVLLEQGALHQALGQSQAALDTARRARGLVAGAAWPVQALYASLRLADVLLPDAVAAEPYLLEAQRKAASLNLPVARYRVSSRLGQLRRQQGRAAEARQHLEAALGQIETLRGGLAHEALRTSFLRDKTAAYEDLILLHLDHGPDLPAAFAAAERAKSRTLLDLLTGIIAPARLQPDDPAQAGQLERLLAELDAVYNKFFEATADTGWEELHARAGQLEQEISQLRLRAAAAPAPEAGPALAGPLPLEALQSQLPADTLLLAYHIVGDEVLAFGHWGGELRLARRLSTAGRVQQLLQRLNAQWDRFRAGQGFARRHMAQLEKSARRILAELHAELLGPLETWLAEARPARLAIVPHGVLHSVPFQALHDGQRYLLQRLPVTYAPSAAVLALCAQRLRGAPRRAVVMGAADALIPAARVEAEAVASRLATAGLQAQALTGEAASLAAVRQLGPGSDVLHLACHGLFRADNPMFSALKLHDGWLTAADALQLDLRGALVALSACESGRGMVVLGDEVLGLPRAFLGAGAAGVLVSLWLVPDETTAGLMADWYGRLGWQANRAEALRHAQLRLMERHPHPYYWAPFVLIGN
jgi:CHAT domain-containing protein